MVGGDRNTLIETTVINVNEVSNNSRVRQCLCAERRVHNMGERTGSVHLQHGAPRATGPRRGSPPLFGGGAVSGSGRRVGRSEVGSLALSPRLVVARPRAARRHTLVRHSCSAGSLRLKLLLQLVDELLLLGELCLLRVDLGLPSS